MSEPVEVPVKEPDFNPPGLDEALDKMNEPAAPVPEKPVEPKPAKPAEAPQLESGETEKLAWLKGLDEQTLKDYREGKAIPKHRFDEVLQRMKVYESFGTPEELTEKLKAPATPVKVDPDPAMSEEDKAARDYFLRLHPELKDVSKMLEEFNRFKEGAQAREIQEKERRSSERNTLIKNGESKIKSLCEAEGLPIDGDNLGLHIGNITDILHSEKNKELADRFYNQRDVEALKTVFDDYYKRFFSGFQRKAKSEILRDKDNLAKLNKPPVKGGAAPLEPGIKKPKTFSEAGDAGWEMIQAANATP